MSRFLPLIILLGFFLELAVMIAVGQRIGVLATLLLIVGGGIAGGAIIRAAGIGLVEALRGPTSSRTFATRDAAASFLFMLAGLLLIIPGFVSDVLGLLLLPAIVRRWLAGKLMASLVVRAAGWTRERPGAATIIDGEAIEIEGEIAERPETARES
jgi:UPF0716 protein FxsA